jgi:hypothetical protein
MDFYLPVVTSDQKQTKEQQQLLTQVILPQISNMSADAYLYQNIKEQQFINLTKFSNSNLISLHPSFGCEFESYARNSKPKDKEKHVDLMQNIKSETLSLLTPYAQFYVIDDTAGNKVEDIKKNAVPIIFNKSFDIDFFTRNRNTTSRGEGAGIQSLTVNRRYDITGDYDPITLNAQFFFSSYETFIRKPAIDKGRVAGISYKSNLGGPAVGTGFSDKVKILTYKELIRRPPKQSDNGLTKGFNLLLEYGWTYSDSTSLALLTPKQREVIDKYEKNYFLVNALQHDINFNPDGSFTLNVEYIPKQLVDAGESQNFKTGILRLKSFTKIDVKDKELQSEIKQLQEDIKDIEGDIKKATKNKNADKNNNDALKKQLKKRKDELKKLQGKNKFDQYAKDLVALARTRKLTNKLTYKIEKTEESVGTLDKKIYKVTNQLILPDAGELQKKSFTVKTEDIRNKLLKYFESQVELELIKPTDDKTKTPSAKTIEKFGLVGADADRIKQLYSNDVLNQILDFCYPETKEPVTVEFMFLRDIINFVLFVGENSLDNPKKAPTYILGNIPFPLPSGDKFWCNLGDIPITVDNVRILFSQFFKLYPEGSPAQLFQFLFNKFLRNYVIDSAQQRSAFPSVSRSFLNFSNSKFFKDNKKDSLKPQFNLLNGDKDYFNKFCKTYFDDSNVGSAEGCIFFGQAYNVLYENSFLFLSEKLNAFRENFFRDDKKLKELGIGKLVLGSPTGLLQNMTFNASSDEFLTNLSYELNALKPDVAPDIISTNYQYNMSATLFGNKLYDFTNLVYVPSYSLGKTASDKQFLQAINEKKGNKGYLTAGEIKELRKLAQTNDFEIGGLYTILSVTDNLQLAAGQYTKNLNASCILRDSAVLVGLLQKFDRQVRKTVLNPSSNLSLSIVKYLAFNNEDAYSYKKRAIKKILKNRNRVVASKPPPPPASDTPSPAEARVNNALSGNPDQPPGKKKVKGFDVESAVENIKDPSEAPDVGPKKRAEIIAKGKAKGLSEKDLINAGVLK